MPNRTAHPNKLIAALLYDGLCMFEFGIAAEIFGLKRPEFGDDWYRFVTCSAGRRNLRTNGHVTVTARAGLDLLAQAGTIVVPGWSTSGEMPSARLSDAVRRAHGNGARIVTICSGVFLPAALGLLSGRRATTHWKYADRLRQLYPTVEVDSDVLYIDEGDIMSSAGSAAGIDLLLHVVRKDFGAERANQVARRLVMAPHREGGQAQFVERPVAAPGRGRVAPLLDSVRAQLSEAWTVARMANEAAMSQRTFIRRFYESVGTSPGEWLITIRLDAARKLLESGGDSLDEIAERVGFGSAATLRHHFRNRLGISPATYRSRFSRSLAVA